MGARRVPSTAVPAAPAVFFHVTFPTQAVSGVSNEMLDVPVTRATAGTGGARHCLGSLGLHRGCGAAGGQRVTGGAQGPELPQPARCEDGDEEEEEEDLGLGP